MGARSAVLFFARREAVGSETKPGEGGCNERKLEKVPVKEEIAEATEWWAAEEARLAAEAEAAEAAAE